MSLPFSDSIYNHLAHIAGQGRLETYKPVGAVVNLEPFNPSLWRALGECSKRSHDEHGVLISSIVVNYDKGFPGGDFFTLAKELGYRFKDPLEFWSKQVRKTHEVYREIADQVARDKML